MAVAHYEYPVRPGDTLAGILQALYGLSPYTHPTLYAAVERGILALNPDVTDPNRIGVGKMLRLPADPGSAARMSRGSVSRLPFFLRSVYRQDERARLTALAWLAHNSDWLTVPAAIATGTASNVLSPANRQLLADVGDLYAEYKSGKISKSAYQVRRAAKIAEFRKNIGPLFERLLYPQGASAAMRGRGAYLLPSNLSATQVRRLSELSRLLSNAGIVISAVGVTAACARIAHTVSQEEKNEIFVETAINTAAGVLINAGIGLYLILNPVGWGAALVLATASTGASWLYGKAAIKIYNAEFREVDLVKSLGVDHLCNS